MENDFHIPRLISTELYLPQCSIASWLQILFIQKLKVAYQYVIYHIFQIESNILKPEIHILRGVQPNLYFRTKIKK